MGKFSLANLFGITMRESADDGSDFTNPDADYRRVFLGEDGELHAKDSAGAVTDLTGAGKELDYVETTSGGTISAVTEATSNVIVTSSSVTFDGTPVLIEFFIPMIYSAATANIDCILTLWEEGAPDVDLGRIAFFRSETTNRAVNSIHAVRRMTPSAAAHQYSIRAYVTAGSGGWDAGSGTAGSSLAGFIRITKA